MNQAWEYNDQGQYTFKQELYPYGTGTMSWPIPITIEIAVPTGTDIAKLICEILKIKHYDKIIIKYGVENK